MAYISPLLTNLVDATKKSAAALDRDFSELEQLQNSVKSIKNFVFNIQKKLFFSSHKVHDNILLLN